MTPEILGTVRLDRVVSSEPMLMELGLGVSACRGVYPFTMNQHGAVCMVQPNGELFGLKPGEFTFVGIDAPLTNRQVGAWMTLSDIDLRALPPSPLTPSTP